MIKNFGSKAFSLIELSIVVLIIGILIAGVIQGSRLVVQSRIKTAQNYTQASPVNSIPDLAIWFETTLDNSVISASNANAPEDGDLISSWSDINSQNSTKSNATQVTPGNQPTYVRSGIGGLPSLSFNGSTSYFTAQPPIISGSKGYTIIAVWQSNAGNLGSSLQVILSQATYAGSCAGNFAGLLLSNASVLTWLCGGGYDWDSGIDAVSRKPYIQTTVVNHTKANNMSLYLNTISQPINGPSPKSPSSYALSSSFLAIGYGGGGGTGATPVYFFNGYISEIIIFNRSLKSSEISDIENYLAKKYAITIS